MLAKLCILCSRFDNIDIFSRSYLALVAALASEADFVFIPEDPAVPNWPEKLCKKLEQVLELPLIGILYKYFS